MADHSTIEWTDATWNPITGCKVKSPGCRVCYAMKLAGTRLKHHPSRKGLTKPTKNGPVWNGKVRFNEGWLEDPLRWRRPRMIFVCAHGDLFYEDVPDAWIDRAFDAMERAHWHTFQVLTKRSARMKAYVNRRYADRLAPPHIWFMVSAERQREADERIPDLLATNAAVRGVSLEPLLGPIDIAPFLRDIDWIIVGGESGDGAQPMHPAWARSLRDQCAAAGKADRFFFKQWGAWVPICALDDAAIDTLYRPARKRDPEAARKCRVPQRILHADGAWWSWAAPGAFAAGSQAMQMFDVGKKAAGRLLDGVVHNGMPAARLDSPAA
jgi:protein gp37